MNNRIDEASTITSIESDIVLPGPFVVLQGMPGDGMANTIDTIPILVDDQPRVASHGTHDPAAVASVPSPTGEGTSSDTDAIDSTKPPARGPDHPPIIHPTTSTTRPGPIRTSASQSSGEPITSGEPARVPQEISSVVRNDPTAAETSSETGYHPGESASGSLDGDALLDDSTSSISSVDPNHHHHHGGRHQALRSTAAERSRHPVGVGGGGGGGGDIAAIGSDGGLHLPIPPSAVAGMGYNTFLAATPVASTTRPESQQSQRHDDSFVLVHSEKDQPNANHHNNNNHNSSSANLSVMSNSSSSVVDISRSFSSHNSSRYMNMAPQERNAIKRWNRTCRQRETQQKNELQMPGTSSTTAAANAAAAASSQPNRSSQWWKTKTNCLAVFETLPSTTERNRSNATTTSTTTAVTIHLGKIVGELAPGCTVMGTEMVLTDTTTLQPLPSSSSSLCHTNNTETGSYKFLRIVSPLTGYVLFGIDDYTYLGPGLPSYYTNPEVWTWRVTCPDGAYVRQGLELTSVHVGTIPYGAFVRVKRKTVNAMGLSRLQVEASVRACDTTTFTPSSSSQSMLRNRGVGVRSAITDVLLSTLSECPPSSSSISGNQPATKKIVGWVSEALNPLSGQSGLIVQPISFPVPVLYCVTLNEGAVIRADVELSSPQIGHAPLNSILTIVGRVYSNHPQDQCIERLKLAGGGGWVSVRLNRPPPRDELVLAMVGIDGAFDPNEPGLYHLEKQKQVMREYNLNANRSSTNQADRDVRSLSESLEHLTTNADLSSIEDGGNDTSNNEYATGANPLENSEISNAASSITSSAVIPALYRSGVATGDNSVASHSSVKGCGSKALADEMCLICLTEKRTATIVHGSTGHIACCLMCSRILKGRGDRCPVCRLPIDSVIQQFWA